LWEDAFYTYDHLSDDTGSGNVDWTVNLVFTMDADCPTAKNALYGYAPPWDAEMWGRGSDDAPGNFEWHKDRGSKKLPAGSTVHFRPYAPHNDQTGQDHFFNYSWWYYCIATSHWDWYWGIQDFGWSEMAEEVIRNDAEYLGYYTFDDYYYFQNPEYRLESTTWEDHWWYNNGWATEIMIF